MRQPRWQSVNVRAKSERGNGESARSEQESASLSLDELVNDGVVQSGLQLDDQLLHRHCTSMQDKQQGGQSLLKDYRRAQAVTTGDR